MVDYLKELTQLTLTVNIMDVLDPPPSFTRSIYTVGLNEGTYSNVSNLSNIKSETYTVIYFRRFFCQFKPLILLILMLYLDMNES